MIQFIAYSMPGSIYYMYTERKRGPQLHERTRLKPSSSKHPYLINSPERCSRSDFWGGAWGTKARSEHHKWVGGFCQ